MSMSPCLLFQAIRFLHECGVLLHYPDVKSKLSQLFFLDPEWLCCLMAQIVTITEVNPLIDKQGVSSTALWKSLSLPPSLPPPSVPPSIPPSSPPLSHYVFIYLISCVFSVLLPPSRYAHSLIFSKSQSFLLSSCRSTFVYWRDLRWFSLRPCTRCSYPLHCQRGNLPPSYCPLPLPDVR